MDQNYTPQMPMVTPTPPPAAGPAPLPNNPTPVAGPAPGPAPMPDNGTLAGDMMAIQNGAQPKKSNKTAGLIIGILILVAVAIGSVFLVIGLTSSGKTGEYEKIANTLTKKIEESKENQIIYLYDDLKKLDDSFGKSPYGNNIKDTAYIYYLDGKPTVCMSDGEHLLATKEGSLSVTESKDDCEFKLIEEVVKEYVNTRYAGKGYKVEGGKTRKVNSFYELDTDKGKVYAKVSYENKKISVTDDRDVVEDVDTVDNEMKAIQFYVSEVLDMPIGSGNSIVEMKKRTTSDNFDYIMIQSSENYSHSLKLIEDISNYLSSRRCPNTMIAIRALVWDDTGIHNQYLIRYLIYAEDGRVEITTLENHEGETK